VTGVIVTIDLHKRDSETKILLGCTREEMTVLEKVHNRGEQGGILIERC
jgi:inorganic pyrophosphatase